MWHDSGNCVVHINILAEKSVGMARIGHFLGRGGGGITAKQSNCYLYQ